MPQYGNNQPHKAEALFWVLALLAVGVPPSLPGLLGAVKHGGVRHNLVPKGLLKATECSCCRLAQEGISLDEASLACHIKLVKLGRGHCDLLTFDALPRDSAYVHKQIQSMRSVRHFVKFNDKTSLPPYLL